ncbi:MAG: hypothetical protein IIW10_03550 [Spirochaetaceae bacterium]|nr:hypothetical protein [Spirochaetaceae bacterium]
MLIFLILLSSFCPRNVAAVDLDEKNDSTVSSKFDGEEIGGEEYTDSLDDLFDTAEDDVIIEDTNIDHMQQFNRHESVIIKGNFTATGGLAGGWKDYDFKTPKATVAANINANISFDLRPDTNFRLFCRFDTEVDPQKFDEGWSGLQIDRLYVDYTIAPWMGVSVGQFPMSWGEGKLFNPANLISGVDSSVNLKISFPLALNGINLIAYGRIRNRESLYSLENFNFAGNFDKVFGKVKFSLGGKYNSKAGINTYFSAKAVFQHIEPYVDFRYDFFNVGTDEFYSSFKVLGGLIFLVDNFSMVTEYFYDGSDKNIKNDHNFGVTLAYRRIADLPLHIYINAQHTLFDNTGGAMLALTYTGFKDFDFRFGIPFLWGKENGRYTLSLNKHEMVIGDFDSNTEFYQNWDKRISAFLTISLSKDF